MKTCVKCGKKGFFLWLSKSGYCKRCVQVIFEEQEQAAKAAAEMQKKHENTVYKEVVRLYAALPKNKYDITPEMMLNIDEHIQAYDDLILFLDERCRNEAFLRQFKKNGTCENRLYWTNNDLGRILFHNTTPNDYIDSEIKDIQTHRYRLVQAANATNNFEITFANILRADIATEENAEPYKLSDIEWPEFKSRLVTSRTPKGSVCDYFVIDVETTGLNPRNNEIIQLCAVKFEDFWPVGAYCTYIKPRKKLNSKAQEINKITWDDVKDAPYIEQVIKDFDVFVGSKAPIVGHNVVFDCGFLYAAGSKAINPKRKYYDTCALSKKTYDLDNYSLSNICKSEFHIMRTITHDALSDSLFCGILYADICNRIIA